MLSRILVLLMAPLLVAGADKERVKQPAKPAKKTAKAPAQPVRQPAPAPKPTIPPEAIEIGPGVFRHTDAQGKSWIYTQTPFGIMKGEDKPETRVRRDELPEGLIVVEDGDSLRFERPSPFGPTRWVKKKTELDEMEQRAWGREQQKKAAATGPGQE